MDLSTLLLSKSEVENLVSMKDAIAAVHYVFVEHAEGRTKSYPRVHIPFDEHEGSIGYLESAVDSLGVSVSKIASLYHGNPRAGLPRIIALITANRTDNGLPIAIMDGNYLTMLRTGAVSALATDHLAKKDAEVLGIIGAGIQGRGQLLGVSEVRKIRKVLIYDISSSAAERFANEMNRLTGLNIVVVSSVSEMKECDIICSATPAKEPLIVAELLHPGLHINSVGIGAGLGKREVDFKILRKMKIVVDDREVARLDSLSEAFRENLVTDSDIHASLGDIVTKKEKGREGDEVTIFVSAGMGIQDVAVAKLAYEKATEKNVGTRFNFFA